MDVNNVANSLLVGAAKAGMDYRIVAPATLQPNTELQAMAREIALRTGARITITRTSPGDCRLRFSLHRCVGVDGEPEAVWEERIRLLKPYQINRAVMEKTGNPKVKFLHCLPAFTTGRRRSVKPSQEIRLGGHGGDRRRVRIAGLHRLRPGREPVAHHQSDNGSNYRRLTRRYSAARDADA